MSSPTPVVNPHPQDSPTDHRSVLEVLGWCLGVLTFLIVVGRLGTKIKVSHAWALDDVFVLVAMVLALCQTGALSAAVHNNLGLLTGTASSADIEAQQKAIYAFNLLFVFSQCFAKLSICVFIRSLTPIKWHRRLSEGIMLLTVTWTIIATFVLAFACSLPQPWQGIGVQCINRLAAFTFLECYNMVLDVSLIILPSAIILGIQQQMKRKIAILATFCLRASVVIAIVVQVVVLFHPQGDQAQENPFLSWPYILTTQLAEYLSIVTACGPYLKPLLENMSSGMIGNDDIARRGGTTFASKSSSQRLSAKQLFGRHKKGKTSEGELERLHLPVVTTKTTITTDNRPSNGRGFNAWGNAGHSMGADRIQQTLTYQVTHEEARHIV